MSTAEEQQARSALLQGSDNYRDLAERHHQLDDRLHELLVKHHLSITEQLEEVTLKKRKLVLKDQMEMMARDYAREHHLVAS